MAPPSRKPTYLVATDGSPSSQKAVEFAIARAKEADAKLLIAMAVEGTLLSAPSTADSPNLDLYGQLHKEARAIVKGAQKKAREAGVDASGRVVDVLPPNDVAVAIVKFAEQSRATQVFVGSHGRTGLLRQLLGSVADKVVRLSHCHVTVVR